MKTVIKSESDIKMEQKLRSYLRRTGRLVPETPAEVEFLLHIMPELTQPQGTFEEAMNVINNGFIDYLLEFNEPRAIEGMNDYNAAARNASKLTDEIRQLMDQDRQQTQHEGNDD